MNKHARNLATEALERAEEHSPPEPSPLVRDTPPAEPYPIDALGPLQRAAEAIHDMTQAPIAIAAQSVLSVTALAAQGHADVESLGGRRPISLYCLTVARSGERKSACDGRAMKPVRAFEEELEELRRDQLTTFRSRHTVWEARRRDIIAQCKGEKLDPGKVEAELQRLGEEPEKPLYASIVSTEPTMEGITKNLPDLRPSLGVFSDEGGSFIGGHAMKSENRLRTLAMMSSLWDGKPADRWRAADGVATFPGRRLSMHLMVQPVAAGGLLADPLAQEQGFLPRFLVQAPDSAIGTRLRRGYRPESDAALEDYGWLIGKLLRRQLPLKDGTRNVLEPRLLTLEADARQLLHSFHDEIEKASAAGGPFETVQPFAAKAAEQACRIAGVLTLCQEPDATIVTAETMAHAIALADHYLNEALRLAGAAEISAETADAERLRRWLCNSWSEPYISAVDATQRGPFKETARSERALAVLERSGWVGPEEPAVVHGKRRRKARRVNRGDGA